VFGRISDRFARAEPRARRYVAGLVAGLERKGGWTLTEQAGEVSPDGMQRLLRRAEPWPAADHPRGKGGPLWPLGEYRA
jgi:hypothetical protein